MDINALVSEAIQLLFQWYKEYHGTGSFNLQEVADKYGIRSDELGTYLQDRGWVVNPQWYPDGFHASISRAGIEAAAPDYFNRLIADATMIAGLQDDWVGLMESMPFDRADFQHMFDLAKEMEERGLAEVQFQAQEVFVRLTLLGKQEYLREYGSGGFKNERLN